MRYSPFFPARDELKHISPVLEQFSRALTNKFLHAPTSAIKQVESQQRAELVNALARLHGIDPEE